MNYKCRIKKVFCFSIFFFFLMCSGCATGNSLIEKGTVNESAQLIMDIPIEKNNLKFSDPGFQEDLNFQKPDEVSIESKIEEKKVNFLTAQKSIKTETLPNSEHKTSSTEPPKSPENNESHSNAGHIVLNFDNADLYEVVRTLAEILQINYIIDPNVRGRVTIQTAGQLSPRELFPVFFQILEVNGLTAVKEGSLYKILRMKEATQLPLSTRTDRHDSVESGERMIIQIIPLQFISVQEMTKLLTPFVTGGGTIVSHEDSNTLLVVDKSSNIEKLLRLTDVFDIDLFEDVEHHFVRLQYVNAEDAGKTIDEIISSYRGTVREELRMIVLTRLNSLMLISRQAQIISRVLSILEKLDVPVEDDEPRIFVYSVKNGSAAELSNLLNAVFAKTTFDPAKRDIPREPEEPRHIREAKQELFPEITTRDERITAVPGERISPESAGTLRGEVKITPDEIRNSLIIEATTRDYRMIENILSRIDILPRQVLIEVTIAEITLDASTELGIEWQFDRGEDFVAGLQSGATLGRGGLNFSYAILDQAKRWRTTVSAMAQKGLVNILSSPSVLASDNKEARINVSTEIPVATTTFTYDGTTTDRLLQTSIQYRNTGVILAVTPHINEYGLVSMDVNQEVSEMTDKVDIGDGDERFSFFKRSVNTSLTVRNGQTIVIGGLIRETKNERTEGIPCVGDIPVLSYLFGRKSSSVDKTELIIFITPKVIASLEDVDIVSEEFRNRIGYDYENFKSPGSR